MGIDDAHLRGPLGLVLAPNGNEARYRVREQLAELSLPSEAVGVTHGVTGQIVLDERGRVVPAESKFTVDLASLKSDRDRRDGYIKHRTLQTDSFPSAVLVPKELLDETGDVLRREGQAWVRPLFISGLGSMLLQRPKLEEIELTGTQKRFEPFWHVVCATRHVYDRTSKFNVPATGAEVKSITLQGTDYPVTNRMFNLTALEHCIEENKQQIFVNGVSGEKEELSSLIGGAKNEVTDLSAFTADGQVVVVPPDAPTLELSAAVPATGVPVDISLVQMVGVLVFGTIGTVPGGQPVVGVPVVGVPVVGVVVPPVGVPVVGVPVEAPTLELSASVPATGVPLDIGLSHTAAVVWLAAVAAAS